MTGDVIHRDEWDVQHMRECGGGCGADCEATGKARATGDGDGVDVGEGALRFCERLLDDGDDGADVGAGGNFGDDAAGTRMLEGLAGYDAALYLCAVYYYGGGCFVATGLEG